jgi:hypothetical protein
MSLRVSDKSPLEFRPVKQTIFRYLDPMSKRAFHNVCKAFQYTTTGSNTPFQTGTLIQEIYRFLDPASMGAFHNVCRAFQNAISFSRSVLDIRKKALDVATLPFIKNRYQPQELRIKLSANTYDEDLEHLKELRVPILSLDISDCPHITVSGLERAAEGLSSLEELHVANNLSTVIEMEAIYRICDIFDLKAIHIKAIVHPQMPTLSLFYLTNSDLSRLSQIPIKSIHLSTHMAPMMDSDKLCEQLSKIPSLEKLTLPQIFADEDPSVPISAKGIAALSALKQLKHLSISHVQDDEAFKTLGKLAQLESLHITRTPFNDLRMICLKPLSHLQKLHVRGIPENPITPDGIAHIQNRPLTELSISAIPINKELLKAFSGFKYLSVLRCTDCPKFEDAGLIYFKDNSYLRTLDLSNTQVEGGFLALLKPLEKLVLKNTLTPLSFKSLESIQVGTINISGFSLRNQDFSVLQNSTVNTLIAKNAQSMNKIQIFSCESPILSTVSPSRFNDCLLKNRALLSLHKLPDLIQATFGISKNVSDDALHSLENIRLRHFTLTDSRISDRLIVAISRIRTLESLCLKNVLVESLTADGLSHLKDLPRLHTIQDATPGHNPIRDYALQHRDVIKSMLRKPWFIQLFQDTACMRIKYPKRVKIHGEGGHTAGITSSTLSWDIPYLPMKDDDNTWVFCITKIAKAAVVQCTYKGQIERNRHTIKPRQLLTIQPQFPPTIIQALYTAPPGATVYLRGEGPNLSWEKKDSIPMEQLNPHTWRAAFRTPLRSFQIYRNQIPENADHTIDQDLGFGYTHDIIPHFPRSTTSSPLLVFQVFYAIPSGHFFFLRGKNGNKEIAIPLVQIGPDLWEGRTKLPLTSYKISIDNQHEEVGDTHSVKQGINACIPHFKEDLELGAPPAVTTIKVEYAVPKGHALYVRADKEWIPMVHVEDRTWETVFEKTPDSLTVSLDGIISAEGGAYIPIADRVNLIKPKFAFEKILDPSPDD